MDEGVAPHRIGTNRSRQTDVTAGTPPPWPATGDVQAHLAPHASYPRLTQAQPCRHPTITEPRHRLRRRQQLLTHCSILDRLLQRVARHPAAQPQITTGLALRHPPTSQVLQHHASPRRGHHFFGLNSFNPSITSICSATSRLSLAFSVSSSFRRRASATSMPPNLSRQRQNVCSEMLCWRHTSRIGTS